MNNKNSIIIYKTEAWKNKCLAENHLKASGVRAEGLFLPILESIAEELPPKSRVLDVGCGHGRLSISLAEKGFHIVASDVSEEMLRLLSEHKGNNNIEIRKADAHQIPAVNNEFDAVISYDFMPHFPDWDMILVEKARVCKVGGKIIFAINLVDHKLFAGLIQNGNYHHQYTSDPDDKTKDFWGEASQAQLETVCSQIGLKIQKMIPIKFTHDNFIFGRALGNSRYDEFKIELDRRVKSNEIVTEFYEWLDKTLFQQLDNKFSYHNLLVLEKINESKTMKLSLSSINGLIKHFFSSWKK